MRYDMKAFTEKLGQWATDVKRADICGFLCALAVMMIPLSTTLTDIAFILATLACLVLITNDYRRLLIKQASFWWILALLVIMIGSLLYTQADFSHALKILKKYRELVFCLILPAGLVQSKWRQRSLDFFCGSMIVVWALINWQWLTGITFVGLDQANMTKGSLFHPYLDTNVLMAFFAFICAVRAYQNNRLTGLWAILAVLVSVSVFMSYGRTGYVIWAALMALFICHSQSFRQLAALTVVVLLSVVLAASFSSTFQNNVRRVYQNTIQYDRGEVDSSIGKRLYYAHIGTQMIKDHPLLGTGVGSFEKRYRSLTPKPVIHTDDPHNEYIYIGVMCGLLGMMIVAGMFVSLFIQGRYLDWTGKLVTRGAVTTIAVGSLANSFLLASSEGQFFAFWTAWSLGAVLAIRYDSLNCHDNINASIINDNIAQQSITRFTPSMYKDET